LKVITKIIFDKNILYLKPLINSGMGFVVV